MEEKATNDLARQVGARIRAARKAAGVTQGEMSKRVGLSQAYLSRIESGIKEGSPSQLLAIANAIGVSVSSIFGTLDAKANTFAGLSDEAIAFAKAWQALPEEQRAAVRVMVESMTTGSNK
ncbi:helix-turn-helix transcriptional regulator [Granulosicoccaceae sp. 1_MG-2023]|nr:helix-turn-helix transcriptional regulator [Granulosicoccaceae sp. 1_MG-2023]